jgi:hypothetical protein
MVVRERIVIDTVVDFAVWISCSFGTKLPYCPVFSMLRVEELYEGVEGVSICALRVGAARA